MVNLRAVVTRRLLLLLDVLCLLGVLWAGVLIAALLTGHRLLPTGAAVGVAAALILPGVLGGLVGNRTTFRGRPPPDGHTPTIWRPVDLPQWVLAVAGVLFLAFWVAGLSAFAGLDQDAAEHARTGYEQRVALGVLGAFGIGATTLAGATLSRTRKRSLGAGEPG